MGWDRTWEHGVKISVLLMRITVQTGERQLSSAPPSSNRFSFWLLFRRITRQCYCNYDCSSNESVGAIANIAASVCSDKHSIMLTCPGDLVVVNV